MDHTIEIQKLYSELSAMENALKDFVKRVSLPHRCGTDSHSKVAHYTAGVTDRLLGVADLVAPWESYEEWRAERAA
jgi:hypothetical protein